MKNARNIARVKLFQDGPEEAGQAQFSGMCERFAVDAVAEQRVSRRINEPVPGCERLRVTQIFAGSFCLREVTMRIGEREHFLGIN